MRDVDATAQMNDLFNTLRKTHGGPAFLKDADLISLRRRALVEVGVPDTASVAEAYVERCSWVMRQLDDPYAAYLTPHQVKTLRERFHGVVGVGLLVKTTDVAWWRINWWRRMMGPAASEDLPDDLRRRAKVARVETGSAADRAGIRVGDELVLVDGWPVAALKGNMLAERLAGPEGSQVFHHAL